MLAAEEEAAVAQRTWLDRQRFRPQQWSSRPRWRSYGADTGEPWFGFQRVHQLEGLPPEIAFIPLIGHTLGHAGIAIDRGDKWVFLAGDAYFYHDEMHPTRPCCTPGLRFYQWMMDKDGDSRIRNQERLRRMKESHANAIELFCSHDVREFEQVSGGMPHDRPVGQSVHAPPP